MNWRDLKQNKPNIKGINLAYGVGNKLKLRAIGTSKCREITKEKKQRNMKGRKLAKASFCNMGMILYCSLINVPCTDSVSFWGGKPWYYNHEKNVPSCVLFP